MTKSNLDVVVTGIDWMGAGVGSIESAMRHLFHNAKREILLTVYSITSGADMLFDWLEEALSRGVEIKIVVNRLDEQKPAIKKKLYRLKGRYSHFHLYDFTLDGFTDLHAKLIVADRDKAIVGSSNLSKRGFLTNYELALVVTGAQASTIASVVDRLILRLNASG